MYFGYPALSDMGILTANVAIIGILINRQNIMMSVIAIELMFYGLNIYLIGISIEISDIMGQIYSLFILAIAAGEAALALAFITSYFRLYQTILIPGDND